MRMHPANDGVEITPVMTGKICNLGPWVLKQTPAQPSLLTTPRHSHAVVCVPLNDAVGLRHLEESGTRVLNQPSASLIGSVSIQITIDIMMCFIGLG